MSATDFRQLVEDHETGAMVAVECADGKHITVQNLSSIEELGAEGALQLELALSHARRIILQ